MDEHLRLHDVLEQLVADGDTGNIVEVVADAITRAARYASIYGEQDGINYAVRSIQATLIP